MQKDTYLKVSEESSAISRVDYVLVPIYWINTINNSKIKKFDRNISLDHYLIELFFFLAITRKQPLLPFDSNNNRTKAIFLESFNYCLKEITL